MSVGDARVYTCMCTVHDKLSCTRLQNYTIGAYLKSVLVSVSVSVPLILSLMLHAWSTGDNHRSSVDTTWPPTPPLLISVVNDRPMATNPVYCTRWRWACCGRQIYMSRVWYKVSEEVILFLHETHTDRRKNGVNNRSTTVACLLHWATNLFTRRRASCVASRGPSASVYIYIYLSQYMSCYICWNLAVANFFCPTCIFCAPLCMGGALEFHQDVSFAYLYWKKSTYTPSFIVLPFKNAIEYWNDNGRIIHLVNTVQQASISTWVIVYLRLLCGSTVMFHFYSLGSDNATPSGLYARLCRAFLVYY